MKDEHRDFFADLVTTIERAKPCLAPILTEEPGIWSDLRKLCGQSLGLRDEYERVFQEVDDQIKVTWLPHPSDNTSRLILFYSDAEMQTYTAIVTSVYLAELQLLQSDNGPP